jgi:ABC-type dipeptide/oligopeptide/nickel transport system permease component
VKSVLQRHRWWMLRTLALPAHIAVFATVSFFLVRLVPGDPVLTVLDTSQSISAEDYQAAATSLGLDGSIWSQFLAFWGNLLHLDLGVSRITGRPIWEEIWSRLPATIELVTVGLLGSVALGLGLAALKLVTSSPWVQIPLRGYGRLAGSIPDFALAIVALVVLYANLRWIPAPIGRIDPGMSLPHVTGFPLADSILTGEWAVLNSMVQHIALPVLVIVLVHTPSIWKQLDLGLEESAAAAPTLFRVASGAARSAVYLSILRRASASAVVMVGALFGGLVGGVVVLEQLFSLGGLGQFAIDSVDSLDFLGLQGFLVSIAALCLVAYFAVDVVNMLLDPRRRPGARAEG